MYGQHLCSIMLSSVLYNVQHSVTKPFNKLNTQSLRLVSIIRHGTENVVLLTAKYGFSRSIETHSGLDSQTFQPMGG